jgi:hypothetical protein
VGGANADSILAGNFEIFTDFFQTLVTCLAVGGALTHVGELADLMPTSKAILGFERRGRRRRFSGTKLHFFHFTTAIHSTTKNYSNSTADFSGVFVRARAELNCRVIMFKTSQKIRENATLLFFVFFNATLFGGILVALLSSGIDYRK